MTVRFRVEKDTCPKKLILKFSRLLKMEKTEDFRCKYVIPRKKRNCRMLVKAGNDFCGEHALVETTNGNTVEGNKGKKEVDR